MDTIQPFDLEAQSLQIQQKRKLAEAFQKQSTVAPQGQMVSGHYIGPGAGNIMNQVLAAYLGKRSQDSADVAQMNYGNEYRKQMSQGLNDYLSTRNGTPGQTMSDDQADALMNGDQALQLTEPVRADPRKAITAAMTSRIPELQKIGQMDFPNLVKQDQGELKELNGTLWRIFPDGSKQPAMIADARNAQVVNGKLINNTGGTVADARDQFNPVGELAHPPGGPAIYGATEKNTGKVEFAPGGSTFNADTTGNKDALAQAGKVMQESKAQYAAGRQSIADAQQIMTLAKDPSVSTGFLAGPISGLRAAGARLGFGNDDNGAAKTQALVASLAKRTLAAGQEMKGSFSDKDIQFLGAVSEGKIDLTPEVLQHAAGLSIAAGHNAMMDAQQQHYGAESVTGAGEISKLYPISPVADHTMSPDQFEETAPGRYRYKSPLLGYGSQTSTTKGTAANPMSYAEYMASQGKR